MLAVPFVRLLAVAHDVGALLGSTLLRFAKRGIPSRGISGEDSGLASTLNCPMSEGYAVGHREQAPNGRAEACTKESNEVTTELKESGARAASTAGPHGQTPHTRSST
jgi:hypothetical protein